MKANWIIMPLLAISMNGVAVAAESSAATPATVSTLMEKSLPALENQTGLMFVVSYPPGGTSSAHRHDANTFVYVLEGSVVMQVAGGEEKTLVPGDTFYEDRPDVHSVSKNASMTEPAKFLVFIIKDEEAPVSMPVE